MRTQTCQRCEREIPYRSVACPYCRRPQHSPEEQSRRKRAMLLAIVLSMMVFVGWQYFLHARQDRESVFGRFDRTNDPHRPV